MTWIIVKRNSGAEGEWWRRNCPRHLSERDGTFDSLCSLAIVSHTTLDIARTIYKQLAAVARIKHYLPSPNHPLTTLVVDRIPLKMHVPLSGTYCFVTSLIASCATSPPIRAAICGRSDAPLRQLHHPSAPHDDLEIGRASCRERVS